MYKFFPWFLYIYYNQKVSTCILLVNLIRGSRCACIETCWYSPLSQNSLLIPLITILRSMSVFPFFSRCTLLIRWTLYLQMFHYCWLLKKYLLKINRINVLKEAILYMRIQIQNIKTYLITSCHAKYKWIHVVSLLFSSSEMPWDQIKAHLRRIWNCS